ncbi:MAG: hypothetical protein GY950_11720 [bacterium]|nr:hypothetical protein [bacterium]
MKIEELIGLHNEALNRKVDENTFLAQRINARLKDVKDGEHQKEWERWFPLRNPVLLYSLLLVIFTIVNVTIINGLKKHEPQSKTPVLLAVNVFQPSYPGSISRAYQEVMK